MVRPWSAVVNVNKQFINEFRFIYPKSSDRLYTYIYV